MSLVIIGIVILLILCIIYIFYSNGSNGSNVSAETFGRRPCDDADNLYSRMNLPLQHNDHNPAYEIKLLYRHGCQTHKLEMLFDYLAKEYEHNQSLAFTREVVMDHKDVPRIVKIMRRPGHYKISRYGGLTNYGSLHDWIFDEKV